MGYNIRCKWHMSFTLSNSWKDNQFIKWIVKNKSNVKCQVLKWKWTLKISYDIALKMWKRSIANLTCSFSLETGFEVPWEIEITLPLVASIVVGHAAMRKPIWQISWQWVRVLVYGAFSGFHDTLVSARDRAFSRGLPLQWGNTWCRRLPELIRWVLSASKLPDWYRDHESPAYLSKEAWSLNLLILPISERIPAE